MILGSYLRGCLWRVGRSKKTKGGSIPLLCLCQLFLCRSPPLPQHRCLLSLLCPDEGVIASNLKLKE